MSENTTSDTCTSGTDRTVETVETVIGTMVVETPKRVYNPTTDKYQDLTKLKEDGYCRQFLALLSHTNSVDTIELDSAPMLSFDADRWSYEDTDGSHLLVKREPESKLGKLLDENSRYIDTDHNRPEADQ